MIQFKQETCGDLDVALRREWLETNGLGGFACSTIIGLNTRRSPPVGRFVLLSKLEDNLIIAGQMFHLSANRYPHTVYPQGFQHLKEFCLDPFPVFTYDVERIEIEKTVFMVQGEAAVQYIVARGDQKTVIAGYHWFGDWGRDTMIALPGLRLPTKKYDIARSILRTFAKYVDQGMLPNRFPDAGEPPDALGDPPAI